MHACMHVLHSGGPGLLGSCGKKQPEKRNGCSCRHGYIAAGGDHGMTYLTGCRRVNSLQSTSHITAGERGGRWVGVE